MTPIEAEELVLSGKQIEPDQETYEKVVKPHLTNQIRVWGQTGYMLKALITQGTLNRLDLKFYGEYRLTQDDINGKWY
jgi:hypothetical protein